MSGRIPQSFVDELLHRTDIVELVDEYVPLKRQRRDFAACCPFHDEKTPSFTVSREKQFFYCFGCQATGSAVGFVMSYKGLEFVEAIEDLAGRLGLDVPREGPAASGDRIDLGPILAVLESASGFYQRQLREHPLAPRAVEYLKGRGLSGEVAGRFRLGFAPPGWTNLATALGTGDREMAHLEAAGLVAKRDGPRASHYDRFRDRIMFPIHDPRGRVVGFGGRVLDDSSPKYLNSPEGAAFHKGRELYGLGQAQRLANGKPAKLLVVEGYMDVVALAQFGVDYAVATLGTAVTREHLERLYRTTRDVVFCFDGDAAGRRAAWRALETALPFMRDGRSARFLFMPEGEDPDTYVRRREAGAVEAEISAATPLSSYLFEHLGAGADLASVEGRSRLVEQSLPLIRSAPPGAFRELLHDRLAEISQIPSSKLSRLGAGARPSSDPGGGWPGPPHREAGEASQSLVRQAIRLLMHAPGLAASLDGSGELSERLSASKLRGIPILVEILELLDQRPDLRTGELLEHFREHAAGPHLARLAGSPPPVLEVGLETELAGIVARLEANLEEQRFDFLASRGESMTEAEKLEFRELLKARGRQG